MANNIYVGGFPYKTSKEDLAKLFSACGTVLSAKVILDRDTGRPKCFGFIEMSTDAEAKIAVEKLNGAFIGDRKIFVVEGRPDRDRPQGYTPKPSFAAKPAEAKPGFVERRSGKDRRQASAPASAPAERRDAPAPSSAPAPFAKKAWVKKPFDAAKKPWEKKPFDPAGKKPWVKKPFDAAAKPWEKKPFDPAGKKPWAKKPFDAEAKPWEKKPYDPSSKENRKPWTKKPFDAAKKPWVKKPFDASKKPFAGAKKPFDRKPPARGPKWTPQKKD